MRKIIEVKYRVGDTVILVTDQDNKRIVTGYVVRRKQLLYLLKRGEEEIGYEECEILPSLRPFKIKGFRG